MTVVTLTLEVKFQQRYENRHEQRGGTILGPFRGVFFESGVKSLGIGEQANRNAA
jgi:hypothetical protein